MIWTCVVLLALVMIMNLSDITVLMLLKYLFIFPAFFKTIFRLISFSVFFSKSFSDFFMAKFHFS